MKPPHEQAVTEVATAELTAEMRATDSDKEFSGDCPCCGSKMARKLNSQIGYCEACQYWGSTFSGINLSSHEKLQLNESNRRDALISMRAQTAESILQRLDRMESVAGLRLLDVGCAYGWFLEAAKHYQLEAVGIEPDPESAEDAIERGLDVRCGFFPDILEEGEVFDLISFNDVLEHLNAPGQVLEACAQYLSDSGRLSITLPSSQGVLYRVACWIYPYGLCGPFERLWQKNFPCPHLHYFRDHNLDQLVERHGFQLVHAVELPTYRLTGLWSRIRMDRKNTFLSSLVQWIVLVLLYPVLLVLHSDIILRIYRRV